MLKAWILCSFGNVNWEIYVLQRTKHAREGSRSQLCGLAVSEFGGVLDEVLVQEFVDVEIVAVGVVVGALTHEDIVEIRRFEALAAGGAAREVQKIVFMLRIMPSISS